MAKAGKHPAHAHIARAKQAMQQHHDQIQSMLDQVAQSLPQDQEQQQPGLPPQKGGPMPSGMSPLGGKAIG